jgi:hypothetical protein
MRKKLWTLFSLIGIAGIVAGCGGGTASASSSSLDPAENVTKDFIKYNFVSYDPTHLRQVLDPSVKIVGKPDVQITPGNAWFSEVANGANGETVYVYFAPDTTTGDQLMQVQMAKENGKWVVDTFKWMFEDEGLPHLSFSDFQKRPEYQSIGITHWTEVKIG